MMSTRSSLQSLSGHSGMINGIHDSRLLHNSQDWTIHDQSPYDNVSGKIRPSGSMIRPCIPEQYKEGRGAFDMQPYSNFPSGVMPHNRPPDYPYNLPFNQHGFSENINIRQSIPDHFVRHCYPGAGSIDKSRFQSPAQMGYSHDQQQLIPPYMNIQNHNPQSSNHPMMTFGGNRSCPSYSMSHPQSVDPYIMHRMSSHHSIPTQLTPHQYARMRVEMPHNDVGGVHQSYDRIYRDTGPMECDVMYRMQYRMPGNMNGKCQFAHTPHYAMHNQQPNVSAVNNMSSSECSKMVGHPSTLYQTPPQHLNTAPYNSAQQCCNVSPNCEDRLHCNMSGGNMMTLANNVHQQQPTPCFSTAGSAALSQQQEQSSKGRPLSNQSAPHVHFNNNTVTVPTSACSRTSPYSERSYPMTPTPGNLPFSPSCQQQVVTSSIMHNSSSLPQNVVNNNDNARRRPATDITSSSAPPDVTSLSGVTKTNIFKKKEKNVKKLRRSASTATPTSSNALCSNSASFTTKSAAILTSSSIPVYSQGLPTFLQSPPSMESTSSSGHHHFMSPNSMQSGNMNENGYMTANPALFNRQLLAPPQYPMLDRRKSIYWNSELCLLNPPLDLIYFKLAEGILLSPFKFPDDLVVNTRTFEIGDAHWNLLMTDTCHEVALFAYKDEQEVLCDWPPNITFSVNDELLGVDRGLPVSNGISSSLIMDADGKAMTSTSASCRPLMFKKVCKPGVNRVLLMDMSQCKCARTISSDGNQHQADCHRFIRSGFNFYVQIVRIRGTVESIATEISQERQLPESEAKHRFLDLIKSSSTSTTDNNSANMPCEISLVCPIYGGKIIHPARSETCQHTKHVDLEKYLRYNSVRPLWVCPICREDMKLRKIVVDGFVKSLLLCYPNKDIVYVNDQGECMSPNSDNCNSNSPMIISPNNNGSSNQNDPAKFFPAHNQINNKNGTTKKLGVSAQTPAAKLNNVFPEFGLSDDEDILGVLGRHESSVSFVDDDLFGDSTIRNIPSDDRLFDIWDNLNIDNAKLDKKTPTSLHPTL